MKKPVALVLGVLVLLLAYVVAGPFIAVHQIREAVKSGDQEALAEQVDFPRLRENLKAQLDSRLAEELAPADGHQDVFASLGRLIAGKLVDVTVDTLVTPASLARMMAGERVHPGRKSRPGHDGPPEGQGGARNDEPGEARREPLANASYRFTGVSRFVARVSRRDDGQAVDFVLTREGLDWRLTNIVLPL